MPAKKRVTRQSEKFGGSPADLPTSDLPTYQDVARFIYKLKDSNCITDRLDIVKIVSRELQNIWTKCNPKLILLRESSIHVKLMRFYDNVIAFNSNKIKKKSHTMKVMTTNKNKLFDILACSCSLPILDCSDRNIKCSGCPNLHIYCSCGIQFKVPVEERAFIKDQRMKNGNNGCLQMAGIDKQSKPMPPASPGLPEPINSSDIPITQKINSSFESTQSHSSATSAAIESRSPHYATNRYPKFALEAVRREISDEAAAALANALLQDVGYSQTHGVIDPSEIE